MIISRRISNAVFVRSCGTASGPTVRPRYFNDRKNRFIAVEPEKATLVRKAFRFTRPANIPSMKSAGAWRRSGSRSMHEQAPVHFGLPDGRSQNPFFYGVMAFERRTVRGKARADRFQAPCSTGCRRSWRRKASPRHPKLKPYLVSRTFPVRRMRLLHHHRNAERPQLSALHQAPCAMHAKICPRGGHRRTG